MGNEKKPLRLDVGEAKEYAENHDVVFLDVVDSYSYEKFDYQIKDAVRISPKNIKDEYEQLPKEKDVLAYCTWPNEETSASVAYFLRKQGYEAFAIKGGLEAWKDAGYDVEDKE